METKNYSFRVHMIAQTHQSSLLPQCCFFSNDCDSILQPAYSSFSFPTETMFAFAIPTVHVPVSVFWIWSPG
jgi:hypothetical protein